jgi:hypothetical protein
MEFHCWTTLCDDGGGDDGRLVYEFLWQSETSRNKFGTVDEYI